MKQRRREGRSIASGTRSGRRSRLDAVARVTLAGWVDARPDATLAELRARLRDDLGLVVGAGTVWNAWRDAWLRLKKSCVPAERRRADIASGLATSLSERLTGVPLRDVVVLEKTYATTKFMRVRGRTSRGERSVSPIPHGHWKLLTVIAAITVESVLTAGTLDALVDGGAFRAFVDGFLVPALRTAMVVVMDNLAAHEVAGVARSIAAAACRAEPLSPYSPNLSPIGNVFAKAKQPLRTTGARDVPALQLAIGDAIEPVTPGDSHGCFAGCGYTLHLS